MGEFLDQKLTYDRRHFFKNGLLLGATTMMSGGLMHGVSAAETAGSNAAEADSAHALREQFSDPPREFGIMGFWFWNGDMEDREVVRQIREMHAKGFAGFCIHPRNGLSRRVGYLTPEFFRLVKLSVKEAERLGMKVVLYDEAGYPAGSARGAVVTKNPEWAAKAIFMDRHIVAGPAHGFWRSNPGRALDYGLVSIVAGRVSDDGSMDESSIMGLRWNEHEVVEYDLPAGEWRLCAVWQGPSGGTTRGAFAEEEDDHATAPPAADILRKDVVEYFIELTHERFYQELGEYFGTTIVAMFTDEPSPRGRIAEVARREHLHAWTPGFADYLQRFWDEDVRLWLPALWQDYGPRTKLFRQAYQRAEQQLLGESFYAPISAWCERHGIALTGHCAHSDEMGTLRHFQWPGQDLVWRMVVPGNDSALEGPDSLCARASASAARLGRRRFSCNEVFGAYGWSLTMDEVKWLLDWLFVRGTNVIFLHAAFYSVLGRRAFESQPDLTVHNVWWPYFDRVGHYSRRMSWLISDGTQICPVGVLSNGDRLSWKASKALTRAQIDHLFTYGQAIADSHLDDGWLVNGDQRFRVIVIDEPGELSPATEQRLRAFAAAGGVVVNDWTESSLIPACTRAVGRDIEWRGSGSVALRSVHYRKGALEIFILSNEGEVPLAGDVWLSAAGRVERWDAMTGSTRPWPVEPSQGKGTVLALRLERRETAIFVVDVGAKPDSGLMPPMAPGGVVAKLVGPWRVTKLNGEAVIVPALEDWAKVPGWELFAGTLCYHTEFTVHDEARDIRFIDMGHVGDIVEARLNGVPLGVRMWAPYVIETLDAVRSGVNHLELRVTNSIANTYDGLQLPSGLMGPVGLRS
ncbi:MAG: hypothetical protein H7A44_08000 [Opitutaceae bacterium]|nr:hypothetical protein [Cephaloticoccus sp.]MCP5530371.1 hypothetical protein [Opitutaceae bacterium]